ncbi:hypothetical protein [Amycolatopsis minnesotensis]|uniref:Mce-associated membrane protein n=1 Tax=Amycolatopsis minnesotensis TaxID=337894 RepID=A0ABN2RRH0_9PSEU
MTAPNRTRKRPVVAGKKTTRAPSDAERRPSPTPRPAPGDEPVTAEQSVPLPVRKKRRFAWRPRRIVAGVLVLLVLGAGGFAGWQWHRHAQLESAREAATGAARQFALDLTSYDFTRIDDNLKKVTGDSTDSFAKQYQSVANNLTQLMRQYKAVAKSTVVQAGIADATPDRAVVLLFVDQTITNTNSPQPRVERNRLQLTVLNQDDTWRLDDVQLR